jgi:hypothetical protein
MWFRAASEQGALALISRTKPPVTWQSIAGVILVLLAMFDADEDFLEDACGTRTSVNRLSGRD